MFVIFVKKYPSTYKICIIQCQLPCKLPLTQLFLSEIIGVTVQWVITGKIKKY